MKDSPKYKVENNKIGIQYNKTKYKLENKFS